MSKMIFLLIAGFLFSQQSITVYTPQQTEAMGKIEQEIIKRTFELYNKKEKKKIKYKIVDLISYSKLFQKISEEVKKNSRNFIAIGQITITKKRKKLYGFSSPYAPVKEVLIGLKAKEERFDRNSGKKVGYLLNTVQEESIVNISKSSKITEEPFFTNLELESALKNGNVNYILSENVDAWGKKDMRIVHTLSKQHGEGYGIIFLKKSDLKNKLNKYLLDYMKSDMFKNFISSVYGKSVANQYLRDLKKLW